MAGILARITISFVVVVFAGCAFDNGHRNVDRGDDGEYLPVEGFSITPDKALELASPHLDRCFELRQSNRSEDMNNPAKDPVDRIYVQGDWYYVCRDSYPAKYIQFYIPHSVRVNGNTGEVIPPE